MIIINFKLSQSKMKYNIKDKRRKFHLKTDLFIYSGHIVRFHILLLTAIQQLPAGYCHRGGNDSITHRNITLHTS